MGIYLGANALGGGGGGAIPVGGVSYFIPPAGTTFTSGQEVYTDPGDNTVWLRSGAQLADGTGSLDAEQYIHSIPGITENTAAGTRFGGVAYGNRYGSNFDGRNVIVYGYNGSNANMTAFQPDGTIVFTETGTDDLTSSASVFYNSTHTFISNRWITNVGTVSLATPNIRYVQTSTLTSFSNYNASGSANWSAPAGFGAQFLACVTNAGTANERHWWANSEPAAQTLTEHTFDPTAANGTSAWTATGNTITLPSSGLDKIQADGNILYAHVNTTLYEYNATTRALINTGLAPTGNSGTVNEIGLVLIPAARSDSGDQELWYAPTDFGASNNALIHKRYNDIYRLTAPFKGTIDSREAITLKDVDANTTFSADNILDYNSNEIYLWQRIA